MNNKNLLIYGGIGLLLVLIIVFFDPPEMGGKKSPTSIGDLVKIGKSGVKIDDPYFPDAPYPGSEDPKLEYEAEKLWPHTTKAQPTEKIEKKVREEWGRFSSKYPKNIYIPNEFKAPLTEKEAADIRKELDVFTEVEASFAAQVSAGKYAEPGSGDPKTPNEPKVTPEQQNTYFNYKIKELESRIQLVLYLMESGEMDSSQEGIAKKDLVAWKKQLEEIKKVAATVPRS